MCTAMGSLWHGPPIVVDVYRAAVGTLVAVFPVIADIQCQAIRDKIFVGELKNQGVRHFGNNECGPYHKGRALPIPAPRKGCLYLACMP